VSDRFQGSERARESIRQRARVDEARVLPCTSERKSRTINISAGRSSDFVQRRVVDEIGKYIPYDVDVTLQFADGVHTWDSQTINFDGIHGGGRIIIQGNTGDTEGLDMTRSVTLRNAVTTLFKIRGCSVRFLIQHLRMRGKPASIDIQDSPGRVFVRWCDIRAYGIGSDCIVTSGAYNLQVLETVLRQGDYGVFMDGPGLACLEGNGESTGVAALQYGYWAQGGAFGGVDGIYPTGGVGDVGYDNGGFLIQSSGGW